MKENIEEKRSQIKTATKFWQTPEKLISPKNGKIFIQAKQSDKYKAKFTKLEQQYHNGIEQIAKRKQNSILNRILRRNWSLANKINSSSYKPTKYVLIKGVLAGGVVYGTIYAGIWGSQNDSDKIVDQVLNQEFAITKTNLVTGYNDAVKYIGEQVQKFPEKSDYYYSEIRKKFLDFYETMKKKFRSE